MRDIVIYGAGGFAREIALLIEQINNNKPTWNIVGYIDDFNPSCRFLNGYPVLGDISYIENFKGNLNIVIGIGYSKGKKIIVNKLRKLENELNINITFPNLIHPSIDIPKFNNLGKGIVICQGSIITCNITLQNFVSLHVNCTIGHDSFIGEYSTVLPNVSVSGNVVVSNCVDLGTNSTIIERLRIGKNTIIGAGSVVIRNMPDNCTAVGVPAKPIKYNSN